MAVRNQKERRSSNQRCSFWVPDHSGTKFITQLSQLHLLHIPLASYLYVSTVVFYICVRWHIAAMNFQNTLTSRSLQLPEHSNFRTTRTSKPLLLQLGSLCAYSLLGRPEPSFRTGLYSAWQMFFFATRSPRSLDRSPWNFATWSESGLIW